MINTNLIRFGGMASGLDTESIVKQLMKAERMKVERFTQRKTYSSWKQDAYREMNKVMGSYVVEARKKMGLQVDFFGNTKPDSVNKMTWLKSAVSSNQEAFSVGASASAMTGNFDLTIEQLATATTASSTETTAFKGTTKIHELLGTDETHIVDLKINGQDLALDATDTLSTVAAKIREKAGLNANFDSGYGMMFINAKETGTDVQINIEGTDATKFISELKLQMNSGQKAKFTFNGSSIEDNSNNININGIDITLKKTTSKTENISISTDVEGAYNKVKEFIDDYNTMIDVLTKRIGEERYRDYQPLLTEQKESMKENDIKLWDEKAKSGLLRNDETINSILQNMRSGMYEKVSGGGAIYEMGITTGNYKDGGKLQIDEKKFKAALQDNPDKVMQTLFGASTLSKAEYSKNDTPAERAQKIAQNKQRDAENGIFVRAFDKMADGIEKIVIKSGPGKDSAILRGVRGSILQKYATAYGSKSEIENNLLELGKRIDAENRKLSSIESRYWKQFTAMEKAVQRMQSQSGWLSQQMGGK